MTNLDVFCKVLNQVTGKPEQRFRDTVCAGIESGAIPAGNLLSECPNGLELVRHLVTHEASGILNWAIQGRILPGVNPVSTGHHFLRTQRHSFRVHRT